MGLTSWKDVFLYRSDAKYAKNDLPAEELDMINRIGSLYLNCRPRVYIYDMKDRIQKLDDFLKLSGRELLSHAGKISAEVVDEKASLEYDKFCPTLSPLFLVEIHFLDNFEQEYRKFGKPKS